MKTSRAVLHMMVVVVALVTTIHSSFAQVVINPHPIVGLQFSSKDILNFDVIYSQSQDLLVKYEASLNDASGRTIAKFYSRIHTLRPGANLYNPTSFQIERSVFFNKEIAGIENTTHSLPQGDYSYCIRLVCADRAELCSDVLGVEQDYSACADAHVEPASPLLLSFPEDKGILDEKRPNFTWIPPLPIGNDPNITYSIVLVKMRNKQTAEDAIRRNRPLYQKDGIKSVNMMFPSQLNDLEEGEHYAWQVSAHIGNINVATSDVWEFEIKENISVKQCIVLDRENNTAVYRYGAKDTLFFIFKNPYEAEDLELLVEKKTQSGGNGKVEELMLRVQEVDQEPQTDFKQVYAIRYGKQMYAIPLSRMSPEKGDFYSFKMNTRDHKSYKILISIK